MQDSILEASLNQIFNSAEVYGKDLLVDCSVKHFNSGSRLARYMIGFGAGAAKATAHFNIIDQNGTKVGSFDLTTKLKGGRFGGDSDETFSYMAIEVINIIKRRFLFQ